MVEDGTPSAQEVVAEFPDLPLRYHATGQHVGRGAAGNLAAQMAAGQYFCFFDEDDWLLPDYVETWQRLLVQHPQALLFAAGSMMECGCFAPNGVWQARCRQLCRLEDGIDALTLGKENPVPIQAVLFSRQPVRTLRRNRRETGRPGGLGPLAALLLRGRAFCVL